jgi:CheY-like chemotaxis protein
VTPPTSLRMALAGTQYREGKVVRSYPPKGATANENHREDLAIFFARGDDPRGHHLQPTSPCHRPPSLTKALPQLSTSLQRMEAERQVISEIVHALNQTANLDELLARIHQALKKVLSAENCFVALHDPTQELAARLKEQRPDLRMLYMSGYSERAAAESLRSDPAVRLLAKPFSRIALLRAVHELLNKN